jgi:glycosyltransferase involved in cell wall biosynthesis
MTKILFLIDDLAGGGAEKVLRTLVNNLDQQKFDITVQTLNAADPGEYLVPGIRYRAVNRCKTALGKKLFSWWFRLCAELKWAYPLYIKGNYDIEVAYLECGPTKVMAGSSNKKALKLAWVHCDLEKKEGIPELSGKLQAYYRTYDKVICVSQHVRDSYIRLFGTEPEALVLPNVNDEKAIRDAADAFSVPRQQGINLVAVGRLTRQKGFDRLLEACALLKEAGYAFHLRILGEGPERQKLEQLIARKDLAGSVQLMGFQNNPYPYIKAADALVCASRYEGLSTVVTEALILGTPVVTTPCSGMEELLGSSEYGLITPDSPQGLCSCLRLLAQQPEALAHYAAAAKRRSADFSLASVLAQTESFLLEELAKKRDP